MRVKKANLRKSINKELKNIYKLVVNDDEPFDFIINIPILDNLKNY